VPGMRIRIELPMFECGLQHEADNTARDRRPLPLGKVGKIRYLSSFNTLLREHTFLGVLFDYIGNFVSLFIREQIAEEPHVGGFASIVKLCAQHVTELSDHAACVVLFKNWKTTRPFIDEAGENFQINLDEFVHSGLTYFEHDFTTVEKPGCMHLS